MLANTRTICNNRACDTIAIQSGRGRPNFYCSKACRWQCHHHPLLRRQETEWPAEPEITHA